MKHFASQLINIILLMTLTACSVSQAATTVAAISFQASNTTSGLPAASTPAAAAAPSVPDALAENPQTHEDAQDYVWDTENVLVIRLNGDNITASAEGVTVDGSRVTITRAGTYSISGSFIDGQVIVNMEDFDITRLVLTGMDLNSSTSAPIYIHNAGKAVIVLADGTQNEVSDGKAYVFDAQETVEPNAIFSTADLTISGSGALDVKGNYNDGIASKDGLLISGGTISVQAVDNGLRGKDYLSVKNSNITVVAQGDGLKADNGETNPLPGN